MIVQTNDYKKVIRQNKEYAANLKTIETDQKNNPQKIGDQYIADSLKKLFSQNDLILYANSLYSYQLQINDITVSGSKISVPLANGTIKIVLTETKKKSNLPDTIVSLGSVTRGDKSDQLLSQISIRGYKFSPSKSADGLTEQCICIITNLKKGDFFTIKLSDQLMQKLDINTNQLTVNIM